MTDRCYPKPKPKTGTSPRNVDYLLALICGFWPAQAAYSENLNERAKIEESYFLSVESAVDALSQCLHLTSLREDREFMAGILESSGLYQVRISAGDRHKDKVRLSFSHKKSQKIVALWHTHGARGFARNYFSPTDTALAKKLQVPFYLTAPSGVISRYDPDSKVQSRGRRAPGTRERIEAGSAKGVIVGSVTHSLEIARIEETFKTLERSKELIEDDVSS